jgi:hypothetical protein
MSTDQCKGIPLPEQKLVTEPIFVTRQVGARMTGVHDATFAKHAVPSAWRRERDGGLSPLYDEQAVEAFRASYRRGESSDLRDSLSRISPAENAGGAE